LDYEKPIETLQQLIDGNVALVMPAGTRLTPMLRDSPRKDMRECFQKCVRDKNALYDG